MKKDLKEKKTVKTATNNCHDVKWFVLRGFKINNKDETGFLAINKSSTSKDVYCIVDSIEDAMKFPTKNVYNIKGFGTPKQWFEFFKGESALYDWKFHLMKVADPRS